MTGFCSAGHIFSLLAKGTYHPEKLGRKKNCHHDELVWIASKGELV